MFCYHFWHVQHDARWENAITTPMLKKPPLDADNLKNYIPVSNLAVMSKVVEQLREVAWILERQRNFMLLTLIDWDSSSFYKVRFGRCSRWSSGSPTGCWIRHCYPQHSEAIWFLWNIHWVIIHMRQVYFHLNCSMAQASVLGLLLILLNCLP